MSIEKSARHISPDAGAALSGNVADSTYDSCWLITDQHLEISARFCHRLHITCATINSLAPDESCQSHYDSTSTVHFYPGLALKAGPTSTVITAEICSCSSVNEYFS